MSDFVHTATPSRATRLSRPRSHSLLDSGGVATILILLGVFLAPALIWVAQAPLPSPVARRSIELSMLTRATLVTLILPILQIGVQIRRHGGSAIRGNREFFPQMAGAAGRLSRAHTNAVESLVAFAAVVLGAHALGVSNPWTVAASTLYLAARITHALAYTMGVTIIRSAAFYAGWIATMVIAVESL